METAPQENNVPEIERLILELARACHWTGLYQSGHPFLSERMKSLHAELAAKASREPSGRLLLGIARDRVLYRDVFLGEGHHLIAHFAESLYLHQVATLGLDGDATEGGLLAFFRCLHDSRAGKVDETPVEFLKREGISGIHLYPYNYKEVLSRKIVDPAEKDLTHGRGDALWRLLLTANVVDQESERKIIEELSGSPELISAILRRASAFAGKDSGIPGPPAGLPAPAVTPEVMRRVFRRLGETFHILPMERKREIFASLDEGLLPQGGGPGEVPDDNAHSLQLSFARSLAGGCSDSEFLDLLSALISAEEKGGKRVRKIFEIIAADRDVHGSLLPKLKDRSRESLRAKDYYAVKTWETIEKLLLTRSEDAYLAQDHSQFLEALSSDTEFRGEALERREPVDPDLALPFEESGRRWKSAIVLLELLTREENKREFLDLLEEVRKTIPNLISRKEITLLAKVLNTLFSIKGKDSGENRSEVDQVIQELDFGLIIDQYVLQNLHDEEKKRILVLLIECGAEAIPFLLDRLLMEQEKNRRKTLISIAVRMGLPAAPAILEKLSDPRWYFVRNICFILGEIGFRPAAQELLRALQHNDPRVKREAILALGKIKAPQAIHPLGKILLSEGFLSLSKEDSVRVDAATALLRIGGTEALGYLHRGISSRRKPVRDHCAGLLRTLGSK